MGHLPLPELHSTRFSFHNSVCFQVSTFSSCDPLWFCILGPGTSGALRVYSIPGLAVDRNMLKAEPEECKEWSAHFLEYGDGEGAWSHCSKANEYS